MESERDQCLDKAHQRDRCLIGLMPRATGNLGLSYKG